MGQRTLKRFGMLLVMTAVLVFGVNAGQAPAAPAIPKYDHVVVAVFENQDYGSIIGSRSAPTFNKLAAQGALLTRSYGVTHPSQPNYLALFSGSQEGVTDDSCPINLTGKTNLASDLLAHGRTFKGYAESLPSTGYKGCSSGEYVRKHAPWADFNNVPKSLQVPFSQFPRDFTKLPTVSFVIPNMCDDMHDCSVATGDKWVRNNLMAYAQWAKSHNSLLVLTFDEDNFTSVNKIPTVLVGQHVKVGRFSQPTNQYNLLSTLTDMYALTPVSNAASKPPLTAVFTP
jgi:hypothetical protein